MAETRNKFFRAKICIQLQKTYFAWQFSFRSLVPVKQEQINNLEHAFEQPEVCKQSWNYFPTSSVGGSYSKASKT